MANLESRIDQPDTSAEGGLHLDSSDVRPYLVMLMPAVCQAAPGDQDGVPQNEPPYSPPADYDWKSWDDAGDDEESPDKEE
jgi:hypothetical protein